VNIYGQVEAMRLRWHGLYSVSGFDTAGGVLLDPWAFKAMF